MPLSLPRQENKGGSFYQPVEIGKDLFGWNQSGCTIINLFATAFNFFHPLRADFKIFFIIKAFQQFLRQKCPCLNRQFKYFADDLFNSRSYVSYHHPWNFISVFQQRLSSGLQARASEKSEMSNKGYRKSMLKFL